MVFKAILTVLALVALASGQEPTTQVEPSSNGIAVDITLSVVFGLSPPDVQDAIAAIRDNKEALRKQIDEAIAAISDKAQNGLEKLESFLANLKEAVSRAGEEISAELKQRIAEGSDLIRNLIDLKRQLILAALRQAQNQLDQAAGQIEKQVEIVTKFLEDGLRNISKAVNSSRVVLQSIKNSVNKAINDLKDRIRGIDFQQAIRDSLDKLNGKVLTFFDVLRIVGASLLAKGNSFVAGLISTLTLALAPLAGLLQGLASLNLQLSLGAGASATGSAGASVGASAGASFGATAA